MLNNLAKLNAWRSKLRGYEATATVAGMLQGIDILTEEIDDFIATADNFAGLMIPDVSDAGETPRLIDVQRRILRFLITECDPGAAQTPAELSDGTGERNRKVLREAGRLLVAKGILEAATEPCDTPEGERVRYYVATDSIVKEFDAYFDARISTLEADAAGAVKQ